MQKVHIECQGVTIEELKECPYCGSEVHVWDDKVYCNSEHCWANTFPMHVLWFNHRALEDKLKAELESYKKAQEYSFQQGLIRNKIDEDRVKLNNAYHKRISKVVKITLDYLSVVLPILRDKLDIHMKQKSWEGMINEGELRNPQYLFTKIAETQKVIAQAEMLLKLLDSIDPEHYNGSATEESII